MDAKPRQAEDEPDYLKELLAQAGIDAQASSVAAKLQEVVIGELHHRMKNTLAIVSAITSQSGNRRGQHRSFFRPCYLPFNGNSRTLHECCETRRAVCTQRTRFDFVGCVRG